MILRKSVLFVSAALYAAGMANATSSQGKTYSLQKINLSSIATQARMENSLEEKYSLLLEGNGLNVQLSSKRKFVREADITGAHTYIIRLKDSPAALYTGDSQGNGATSTLFSKTTSGVRNRSLRNDSTINAYVAKLKNKQHEFVNSAKKVGVSLHVEDNFQVAINAITATLTQDEAEKLAKVNQVAFISRVVNHELLMDVAPTRTNVPDVWQDATFAEKSGEAGLKGEGILVGVIDTGINSDHPSFAAVGGDGYEVQNPLGSGNFLHDCAIEENESMCNDKLIGVWSHPLITAAYSDPEFAESRPATGEDYQGHGSHTASIAAGNVLTNVPYKLPAMANQHSGIETGLEIERISGIAPHANIISYQVCYPGVGGNDNYRGCPSVAGVAAIEQAILDGVDVLNYSISGGMFPHEDPVELAFLAAHEAGINVAASAGNSGAFQTVSHVSPWLLSVASTQHGRHFNVETSQSLEGLSYSGTAIPASYRTDIAGITTSEVTGPVVLAEKFGDALCENTFAPGTFTNNEIVLCERGEVGLIFKSENAAKGGASAVIIYNTDDSPQDFYPTLPHVIPTMQMDKYDAPYMINWLNDGSDHMATIPATETSIVNRSDLVDAISSFSSIGHAYYDEYRESTAPSIAAPGSDIYSAYADDQPFTNYPQATDMNSISGTSMSGPHIAGALALIKQAQPQWTPSEVMSAIQLTANDEVGDKFGRPGFTSPWFYGSGIAQVDKAIHSGLVMNVPVENYTTANPTMGGNIGALNTPNMVDASCYQACTWVREVTAAVDGAWTIATETDEYSVGINVSPAEFTLKAGETQRLIITGSWVDSRSLHSSPRGLTVMGKINLSHESNDVPNATMNVEMVLNSGDLPEVVDFNAHGSHSTNMIKGLPLSDAPELQVTAYEPVKGNIKEVELIERANGSGTTLFEIGQDESVVHVEWVQVPENSKRFIAEVIEHGIPIDGNEKTAPIGNVGIYVGIDANEDGMIQYDDEVICKSVLNSTEIKDWCNLPNPEGGDYWVAFQEHSVDRNYAEGMEPATFKHKISTAVVLGDIATSIVVDAPATSTLEDLSDIGLSLDYSDWELGDKIYSAVDFGTDSANSSNIGMISTSFTRGLDEVSMSDSTEGGMANQTIDYNMSVMANSTGADRNFSITGTIPEGLELVAESVIMADNRFFDADIAIDGNNFTISGIQLDTRDTKRSYTITNSLTDPMCKTPVGDGGYVDLNEYGFTPVSGAPNSNSEAPLQITFNEIFKDSRSSDGEQYSLYGTNTTPTAKTNSLFIHSNGMVSLTGRWHATFGAGHQAYNDNYNPFYWSNMGVFWHGAAGFGSTGMQFGAPYSLDDNGDGVSGVSFASLVDDNNVGSHVLIEWDNLQHVVPDGVCGFRGCPPGTPWKANPDSTTKIDAQVIISRDYDSAEGAYEMVYAYNNMVFGAYAAGGRPYQVDLSIENAATAGVVGYSTPSTGAGPQEGWHRQSIIPDYDGFGGLDQFLQDDMSVCFDYVGPEVSAFDIKFSVKVLPSSVGQNFNIMVNADIEGAEFTKALSIPSNITLFEIEDQTTDENETLTGIQVAYMDNNNVSNKVTVSGEGISAVIDDHTSGSTFDIVPNAGFHGDTEVTVTVSDVNQPTDLATTSFMLTVVSDGIELGCTDQGANNFDASANSDNGSCKFPIEAVAKKSSGGSFGITAMILMLLAGSRRKLKNK